MASRPTKKASPAKASNALVPTVDFRQLQRVLPEARRLEFAKGEVILKEGSTAGACYMVLKGRVQITKKTGRGLPPLKLATMKTGEFIGEMALLSGQPRTATATALTAVRLLEIKRAAFKQLIAEQDPYATQLALHFASALAGRCANLLKLVDATEAGTEAKPKKEPVDPREVLNQVYSLWAV